MENISTGKQGQMEGRHRESRVLVERPSNQPNVIENKSTKHSEEQVL